ncbi:MAG: hypothetical protein QM765_31795 [Myxococcales bacterium]
MVLGVAPPDGAAFVCNGKDYAPLLRQIVSGELDADRIDYLLRDSLFTGVTYGRYEMDWIVENLLPAEIDGRVHLALSKTAIFAFEDFLLSRFHMFVSVYYHHSSVNYDAMLRRYRAECPDEIVIPSDMAEFVECDDVWLAWWLRKSQNVWARRIVERKGFKLVASATGRDKEYDFPTLDQALTDAGIEHFQIDSFGALSKYFASDEAGPSLYVVDPATGLRTPVAEYTPLYRRYAEAIRLTRLYCRPDQAPAARDIVAKVMQAGRTC